MKILLAKITNKLFGWEWVAYEGVCGNYITKHRDFPNKEAAK